MSEHRWTLRDIDSVLKCAIKNYNELVTVVGNLLDATVGSALLIDSNWKVDAEYAEERISYGKVDTDLIKRIAIWCYETGNHA